MQGIEECSICYCILHTNNELPKRTCRTCKKKFHDACLVSWNLVLQKEKFEYLLLLFSFVGFDHRINQHVHIVVRTSNSFSFSFDINVCFYGIYFVFIFVRSFVSYQQQSYFSSRLLHFVFMSVDKAKEAAAFAAVDEQINSVREKNE